MDVEVANIMQPILPKTNLNRRIRLFASLTVATSKIVLHTNYFCNTINTIQINKNQLNEALAWLIENPLESIALYIAKGK